MERPFSVQYFPVVMREILETRVRAGLNPPAADWFSKALTMAAGSDRAVLLQAYTEASRRLGRSPLPPAA
jgi:hypothetical protein